jgi:hypothetical protein
MNPVARKDDLTIEKFPQETVVYDHRTHKVHCLSLVATGVWACCLAPHLDLPADEALTRAALLQLHAADLLEPGTFQPDGRPMPSRRELARRLHVAAAVMLPLVMTMTTPTPAAAQSNNTRPPRPPRPGRPPRRGR